MKARYFFTFALALMCFYVLGTGCLQDFGALQPCSFGQKVCGTSCVSVADAEFGCGSEACTPCGLANATNVCDKAVCAIETCNGPFMDCDGLAENGCEADCGLANATSVCDKAVCAIATCDGTFENCDGAAENGCEADTANDPEHCGACGKECITPHALPACELGLCEIGTCDPTWADCDGDAINGCEASTDSDPSHCGDCDIVCPAQQSCKAGKCVLECDPGEGDCDNNPNNGCETTFGTENDCAFCGDACDLANANDSCTAGLCVIDSCDNGFEDCDNVAANGCEADTDSSAATCGACDNACPNGPNGSTTCDNGACEINCNAGFGDCDGTLQNGCETDTGASQQSCGGCNLPCTIANGAGMCAAGVCQVTTCAAPFEDCNDNPADGCESNTNTSVMSCSGCGTVCSFPNAQGICNNGTCQLGPCTMGFVSCDNLAANGCESNTATSVTNCGACGRACNSSNTAALSCTAGLCNSTCNAGFSNCSQPAAPAADNGCETNTGTNVDNCGGCGRACSGANVASKSCTAGLCDSTCALGAANCTMPAAPANDNGCELTTAGSNDDNCGGCGNSCSMQGTAANDMECDLNIPGPQNLCGCSSTQECDAGGGGTCIQNGGDPNFGHCLCGGNTCVAGEACAAAGGACACNGAAACTAGQTCCQTPAGCKDLGSDVQSCGACGHACPPGFACAGGACQCDAPEDCNAGSAGACLGSGLCQCGPTTCTVGKRCQPNGQCG